MMCRDGGGPGVTLLQPPVMGFVSWSASVVSSRMELAGFVHHGHCEGVNFLVSTKVVGTRALCDSRGETGLLCGFRVSSQGRNFLKRPVMAEILTMAFCGSKDPLVITMSCKPASLASSPGRSC